MTTFVFSDEVPGVKPSSSQWELVNNTRVFQSPLTGAIQTAARKGSHWKISLTFSNLSQADRANMQAFLASLEGQEHRFTMEDHAFSRRGTGADTGLVTASSSGNTLNVTRTLTHALTIEKGDYLSANNQLFMATAKVNGTTATSFSISVSPLIRSSSLGEVVELDTPKGTFILTGSTAWDNQPGVVSTFSIEAIEDVLA